MSDETSPAAEAPDASGATMTEPPASPYDAPSPGWTAGPAPAPARARPGFRDRIVKLWLALTVGAACLVVGLGLGALIGHATGGSGTDGRPGIGSGQLPGPDGQGFGRQGSGQGSGQGFGQAPGMQQDGTQQGGTGSSGTSS